MTKLAAPGAGLPFLEALILRYVAAPVLSRAFTISQNQSRLIAASKSTLALASSIAPAAWTTPVLIKRIAGLEDSSREWSVSMTLEHLVIVETAITQIILGLSQNQQPPVVASTAAVKPFENARSELILEKFTAACEKNYAQLRDLNLNWNSDTTSEHPWFGQMNMRQWLWLLPTHQGIHQRQLQLIQLGLGEDARAT